MRAILQRLLHALPILLPNRAFLRLEPDLLAKTRLLAKARGMRTEVFVASLLEQAIARQEAYEQHQRGWEALTGRERQVAALLRQGMRTAEIAERLVLTPTTVKSHLQHAAKKFGVRTRAELLQALEDIEVQNIEFSG